MRVFSHETRGRKELAITKVVAPGLKIRKSDKLFWDLFAEKSLKGFV